MGASLADKLWLQNEDPRPRKRPRAYSSPLEQAIGIGLSAPRIPIKPLPNVLPQETADELAQLPGTRAAEPDPSQKDVDMRDEAEGDGNDVSIEKMV